MNIFIGWMACCLLSSLVLVPRYNQFHFDRTKFVKGKKIQIEFVKLFVSLLGSGG